MIFLPTLTERIPYRMYKISRPQMRAVARALEVAMKEALMAGEKVAITGLCSFFVRPTTLRNRYSWKQKKVCMTGGRKVLVMCKSPVFERELNK